MTSSGAVAIAVVDSGWDTTRTDARVRHGFGLASIDQQFSVAESLDYHDRIGHGTECIDAIFSSAPDVCVLPIRVFGKHLETSPEIIVLALERLVETDVRVVSLSLDTIRRDFARRLYDVCSALVERGATIVAAARPFSDLVFPAAFDNVIAVGPLSPTDPREYVWNSSDFPECRAHCLPVPTLYPRAVGAGPGGASLATARMAGVVARYLTSHPDAGQSEVREALIGGAARAELLPTS